MAKESLKESLKEQHTVVYESTNDTKTGLMPVRVTLRRFKSPHFLASSGNLTGSGDSIAQAFTDLLAKRENNAQEETHKA